MLPIKKVPFGVANRYDDCIEVHEKLHLYPYLYKPIIEHERSHTDKKWSIKDFLLDLRGTPGLSYFKLWVFCSIYPSTLVQLLPVFYHPIRKTWVYDLNHLLLYMLGAIYLFMLYYIVTII